MFDRNYTTTWLSGKKQTKGDYIVINLGSSHNFRGIYINPFNAGDYFSGYEISTSADGVNFGSPVTSGATTSQKPEIYYQSKRPITASYIKITLTVTSDKWWSIANFDITGPVK
jgi:hypothetical protein